MRSRVNSWKLTSERGADQGRRQVKQSRRPPAAPHFILVIRNSSFDPRGDNAMGLMDFIKKS